MERSNSLATSDASQSGMLLKNEDVWEGIRGRCNFPDGGKYLKQLQCELLSVLPWAS